MPLTLDDYKRLLKHFLAHVKMHDQVSYEHLMQFVQIEHMEPRQALLTCIRKYSYLVQPASKGTHGAVLRLLNENIQGDIRGINVLLSPPEQELYGRESLDLVPYVDKSRFVEALHELHNMIEAEDGGDNDSRRNQR